METDVGHNPSIILVETQLADNLGAVARAMANFGLDDLRLVNPKVSKDDPKTIATAVGASFLLAQAQVFPSLREASKDLTHLFGTTACEREMIKKYYSPKECASFIKEKISTAKVGIVLGPERTGLNNEDLSECYGIIHIPVNPNFSSLNLGQALVIIAYECFVTKLNPTMTYLHLGSTKPASQKEISYFLDNLESKLNQTHFWRTPSKKPIMWRNLRNIFTRMDLTQQEIRTLNGIIGALSPPSS
jgi:tRNA/rRNA methyltransferase